MTVFQGTRYIWSDVSGGAKTAQETQCGMTSLTSVSPTYCSEIYDKQFTKIHQQLTKQSEAEGKPWRQEIYILTFILPQEDFEL